MVTWRVLLLVYRAIDLPGGFHHVLSEAELAAGRASFERFPALATSMSGARWMSPPMRLTSTGR